MKYPVLSCKISNSRIGFCHFTNTKSLNIENLHGLIELLHRYNTIFAPRPSTEKQNEIYYLYGTNWNNKFNLIQSIYYSLNELIHINIWNYKNI